MNKFCIRTKVFASACISLILACASLASAPSSPTILQAESASNPIGLDETAPRFSWQLPADIEGVPSAYEIQVAASANGLKSGKDLTWSSGKTATSTLPYAVYSGPSLQARAAYAWRVRTSDEKGRASKWSEPASFEMGLLGPTDWSASQWIGGRQTLDNEYRDFRATVELTLSQDPVGVLFRARPVCKIYGEAYLWILGEGNGAPALTAQVRTYPGGSSSTVKTTTLKTIPLPGTLAELQDHRHTLVIEAQGSQIRTSFDGLLVDTLSDNSQQSGAFGFVLKESRTLKDASTGSALATGALVHSVKIESEGRVQFFENFAENANPYTGGVPTKDGLLIPGQAVMSGRDIMVPMSTPAPLLRKSFAVDKPVRTARFYVAAGGFPKIHLNGERIDPCAMADGNVDYTKTVPYRAYDVTRQLRSGENVLGFELGRGWYGVTAPCEWYWQVAPFHDQPNVRAQLEVTFQDGTRQIIGTDGSWKTQDGPTLEDSIFGGERFDARKIPVGWLTTKFDDGAWVPASLVKGPAGRLTAATYEPIKEVETIQPISVNEVRPGVFVFDFGRIVTGWALLHVQGPAGRTVSMTCGEQLKPNGFVAAQTSHIAVVTQYQRYILAGTNAVETWEPAFNYGGFRYIQLDGFPGKATLASLIGKISRSAVASRATFECANELLNKINQAARYTIANNIQASITDTPTYEKNAWTGDGQAAFLANLLNFDGGRIWEKWMNDFRDSQSSKGEIPEIVPSTPYYGYENSPSWAAVWGPTPSWDAATFVVPWELYQLDGNHRILERMYETQKRLADYTGTYLREDNNFFAKCSLGEYFGAGPAGPVDATATAFYYYELDHIAKEAEMLGKTEDTTKYRALAEKVSAAYNARYFDTTTGQYRSKDKGGKLQEYAQTMNVLPVAFGLVPAGREAEVMTSVDADIRQRGYLATTGIFALRHMMTLLSDYGYTDTAYKLACRREAPSWGNWIDHGLMTMCETWSVTSRSHNHPYFGSISSWFLQSLGGIRPDAPGYAKARIQPRLPTGLASASASLTTVRGEFKSAWVKDVAGAVVLDVTVPVGVPTEVWVPTGTDAKVHAPKGAELVRAEPGYAVYIVVPGRSVFHSSLAK